MNSEGKIFDYLNGKEDIHNKLVKTIGSAFSSSEQIYYGDIAGEQVQSISKEIVDIFCLIQQIKNIDKNNFSLILYVYMLMFI